MNDDNMIPYSLRYLEKEAFSMKFLTNNLKGGEGSVCTAVVSPHSPQKHSQQAVVGI